jgi:ankyrin repeat protein
MLLAKNAYVNSKTKAGWTPLHFVAFKGFNEMINPLVSKHNAAIDATSMVSFIILVSGISPNRV